jgi:L-threonylcarbamoyladenylate synthase
MNSRKNSPEPDSGARIVRVDPQEPDATVVAQIVAILRDGGIVVLPTDTMYGLAAAVSRADALERLCELKTRPRDKGFILLVADWVGVRAVTSHLPPVARRLGGKYWPGPLTLILPARAGLPSPVSGSGVSVGVRMPGDPLLQAVLRELKGPLAAPSANRAGEEPAETAAAAAAVFGGSVELVVDGGPAPAPRPSTIVSAVGPLGHVLREGSLAIPAEDLHLR